MYEKLKDNPLFGSSLEEMSSTDSNSSKSSDYRKEDKANCNSPSRASRLRSLLILKQHLGSCMRRSRTGVKWGDLRDRRKAGCRAHRHMKMESLDNSETSFQDYNMVASTQKRRSLNANFRTLASLGSIFRGLANKALYRKFFRCTKKPAGDNMVCLTLFDSFQGPMNFGEISVGSSRGGGERKVHTSFPRELHCIPADHS